VSSERYARHGRIRPVPARLQLLHKTSRRSTRLHRGHRTGVGVLAENGRWTRQKTPKWPECDVTRIWRQLGPRAVAHEIVRASTATNSSSQPVSPPASGTPRRDYGTGQIFLFRQRGWRDANGRGVGPVRLADSRRHGRLTARREAWKNWRSLTRPAFPFTPPTVQAPRASFRVRTAAVETRAGPECDGHFPPNASRPTTGIKAWKITGSSALGGLPVFAGTELYRT